MESTVGTITPKNVFRLRALEVAGLPWLQSTSRGSSCPSCTNPEMRPESPQVRSGEFSCGMVTHVHTHAHTHTPVLQLCACVCGCVCSGWSGGIEPRRKGGRWERGRQRRKRDTSSQENERKRNSLNEPYNNNLNTTHTSQSYLVLHAPGKTVNALDLELGGKSASTALCVQHIWTYEACISMKTFLSLLREPRPRVFSPILHLRIDKVYYRLIKDHVTRHILSDWWMLRVLGRAGLWCL